MKRRLVTGLLCLSALFGGGMAQTRAGSASVSFQNVLVSSPTTTQAVEFVIDTSTVSNYEAVSVAGETTHIGDATKGLVNVPMPTRDEPFVYVSLESADVYRAGGGEYVLVLGKKGVLEFSAENTARAGLTRLTVLYMVTREEALQAHDLFPKHPKFAKLVALYSRQKGLPAKEPALTVIGTLQGEILIGVMNQLRRPGGTPRDLK